MRNRKNNTFKKRSILKELHHHRPAGNCSFENVLKDKNLRELSFSFSLKEFICQVLKEHLKMIFYDILCLAKIATTPFESPGLSCSWQSKPYALALPLYQDYVKLFERDYAKMVNANRNV